MSLQTNRNNGGIFYGWVILATSFLTTFISWGFYYSFGVFFQSLQTEFNANRADISLISSILIFTMYMMGLFYGWAIDKYDSRISVGIGGIATCAGLLLSSQATAVWQLYLSLGLLVGFGVSSTTVPLLSTLARWFAKMRGLVLGIVTAGAGAGMMIMAPLLQRLITNYGWRDTFSILGIASFVFFAISAVTIRGSPQQKGLLPYGTTEPGDSQGTDRKPVTARATVLSPPQEKSLSQAMKSRDLWLVLGIRMVMALTTFMVSTHLVNYAKDAGMAPTNAALLMTFVGTASIFGKVGAGYLVDRIGSKKIIIICAATLIVVMLWLATPMGTQMLPLSAVIYGLVYGGSFLTLNTMLAEAFGVRHMGRILGFANMGSGVGSLTGPWLAGYVFDATGNYSVAFLVAAGASLAGIVLVLPFGKSAKS